MKRAAILYNPVAGSGDALSISHKAHAVLTSQDWSVERIATRGPGDAEALTRSRAETIDLLVVAGGDGSLREAMAGLGPESRRVTVAFLPCGNANVVARELGIPCTGDDALEVLHSGTPTPIDLGRIDSELFLAMVGVGWDARTVRHLDRMRKTRLGASWYRLWADSAYLVAGFAAVCTWPLGRIRLQVDGQADGRRYCAVQIANFRCYGKGWTMVPAAHRASGRLHFQARKRAGPLFILWQFLAAVLHRPTPNFVSDHGDGTRIVVQADRAFAVQVDGDEHGRVKRIEIEIEPGAASILAPAVQSPPPGATEAASTASMTRSRFSPSTFRTVSGE